MACSDGVVACDGVALSIHDPSQARPGRAGPATQTETGTRITILYVPGAATREGAALGRRNAWEQAAREASSSVARIIVVVVMVSRLLLFGWEGVEGLGVSGLVRVASLLYVVCCSGCRCMRQWRGRRAGAGRVRWMSE